MCKREFSLIVVGIIRSGVEFRFVANCVGKWLHNLEFLSKDEVELAAAVA